MSFEFVFNLNVDKEINLEVKGVKGTEFCNVTVGEKFKKVHTLEVKNFIAVQIYKCKNFTMKYRTYKFDPRYEQKDLENCISKFCKKNKIKTMPEQHSYKEEEFVLHEEHMYTLSKMDEKFVNGIRYLYLHEIIEFVDLIFPFVRSIKNPKESFYFLDITNGLEKFIQN